MEPQAKHGTIFYQIKILRFIFSQNLELVTVSTILSRVVLTVLSRANVLTPVSPCELGVGSRYTVLVESRGGAPENFQEIKAIYHTFLQYRHVKSFHLKIDGRINYKIYNGNTWFW